MTSQDMTNLELFEDEVTPLDEVHLNRLVTRLPEERGVAGQFLRSGGSNRPEYASIAGTDIATGTVAVGRLPVGAGSGQVAAGNHTHTVAALGAASAAQGVLANNAVRSVGVGSGAPANHFRLAVNTGGVTTNIDIPTGSSGGGAGVRGRQVISWTTAGNLTNITQVAGLEVGDMVLNGGTATRTILGVSSPVGTLVRVTSATAGTNAGNIRGAQGVQGQQGPAGPAGPVGPPGSGGGGLERVNGGGNPHGRIVLEQLNTQTQFGIFMLTVRVSGGGGNMPPVLVNVVIDTGAFTGTPLNIPIAWNAGQFLGSYNFIYRGRNAVLEVEGGVQRVLSGNSFTLVSPPNEVSVVSVCVLARY